MRMTMIERVPYMERWEDTQRQLARDRELIIAKLQKGFPLNEEQQEVIIRLLRAQNRLED